MVLVAYLEWKRKQRSSCLLLTLTRELGEPGELCFKALT